MTLFIRELEEK